MSTTEYKLQAVWSIKKETFLKITDKNKIQSEIYDTTLPNVQYSIYIDLNDKNKIVIMLGRGNLRNMDDDDDDFEKTLIDKMTLFIPSANYQKEGLFKWDELDLEELLNPDNKYFVNDILTLEFRGIIKYERKEFNLGHFLWEKDDQDFKFIVGDRTIKAHKYVVRQFSSVFAAAIDSGEFKIDNFDLDTVEDALKLCYGIELSYEFNLNTPYLWSKLFEIIEFSNFYDMLLVKQQVEHKFEKLVTSENVCELANKSLELKADILRSYCVNFLSDCIKNGKPFNGTLNDLKTEIVLLVLKSSFCHTQTS